MICNMPGAAYVTKLTETTTLPIPGGTNLNQSKRLTWDSSHNGNVTKVEEWNFYTGSSLPATVDRTTNITYLTGTNYSSRNIVNRPTNITVTNASGSTISQTLNSYDGPSLTSATGKSHHDDTNYGTGMNYRGNLTQVQRLVSGSTYLTSSMTYDTLGNVLTAKDSNNNQTSYDYTDNLYDDPGDSSNPTSHSVSPATNAYLKTITYPTVNSVTLTTTMGYYWGTGKVAKTTDANGNISYSHFHEPLDRSTATLLPNNEWTRTTYNSTDTQVDTYTGTTSSSASTSCTVCRHDRTVLDALGRATSSLLVNDPDGQTTVATTYDSGGRVATASTPYRNTSDPTYGLETPGYDGLGRATQVQHADGDYAYTFYGAAVGSGGGATSQSCSSSTYGLGYPVLIKDEVGNKRQTWTNGFGKVIETDEPNASGTLNVNTCYTYDANGNLTQVSGQSSQTRSYAYDLLSRVTQTATPESGATNFYYTTSGGALCSGDPSAVCRRTDARSITATYSYDALNRVIQISYNDSSPTTPTVKYGYDAVALSACTTAPPSLTITNGLGQRTAMCDGSGGTTWSYDSVGNKLAEKRTINSQTKTINYAYNLDGSIYTIQYPGNRTVTYTEGNAQRMTVVQDNPDSTTYATSATYAPQGALASVQNGANAVSTLFYNNRLETCRISVKNSGTAPATCASSTTGNVLDLSYSYAQSSHNNGNIATQTNNVTGASGRTQNYTYDTLNRLLTAQAAANSGVDCWGQSFGNNATPPTLAADALNNLLNINATKCSSPSLSVSGSTSTNQFTSTGYSYDSAGNNTADSLYTYTYDAENRIRSASVSGATYCYTYDGDGLRVMKAHGSNCSSVAVDMLYWRSVSGDTIAETDGGGSTTNASYHEYIFFAGQRIAQSNPSSSSVYFYFADHLGSTRVVTNASGSPCYEADFLPYGTENTPSGFTNTCSTNYKFTGYERDTETGLDYAFARYYNQRMGRFMSGDSLAGGTDDPRSLNRYSNVVNNPVNLVDPSGALPAWGDAAWGAGWGYLPSDDRDWQIPLVVRPRGSRGGSGFYETVTAGLAQYGANIFQTLHGYAPSVGCSSMLGMVICSKGEDAEYTNIAASDDCAGIAGKGGFVQYPTSRGTFRFEFNTSGNLVGVGVPLTGGMASASGGYTVPPNTYFGAKLNSSGSVTIGFNNPIRTPQVFGAYIKSAAFSGGSFTQAVGAIAIGGVAIGSPNTPSSPLVNQLNKNTQAKNIAAAVLGGLQWTSQHLSCNTLLGALP